MTVKQDLIPRDVSRCSDSKCPTAAFCDRYLQLAIDNEKNRKRILVTDFKGRHKPGLCEHFLNIEDL